MYFMLHFAARVIPVKWQQYEIMDSRYDGWTLDKEKKRHQHQAMEETSITL